ncbi:MAG: amidase [Gemmatimonadetes bacterium]|nr:amidase [Gemmatimonadota bacterium]NIR78565.1 amidase [Gemmatimonadota bacterium]NIT86566.1 amidase [Gemmatimonadota bacterium]NIU31019.1 amidase [Gemmatimonadota bacterium]NIU35773.1 amidase [Gemmatimonadota bacterium]
MTADDYLALDGLAMAGLARRGEVTARELLETALDRADRLDPLLNAVVHRFDEEARARASAIDDGGAGRGSAEPAPFRGVPFLVKDVLTTVAGHPHTSGSRLLEGWVADEDSEVVARFRAAGAILFGKTNAPEFGLTPYTEPELFGPCRNPWDPSRTPGGSSGGSAAAVAAGIVPLAGGNDGGGSIRIPAACCGLFGLKPSRGRVPSGPYHVQVWRGLATDHVLTRSVRDSAAMLDAISGPEPGVPSLLPGPERPYLDEVGRDPGRLRVAFTAEPWLGSELDPECRAAVEDAAGLLEEMGHRVEEATPTLDAEPFARAFLTLVAGELGADLRDARAATGRKPGPATVEPETWALHALGRRISAVEHASALRRLERAGKRVALFFQDHDLLLTPTLSRPPAPVGSLAASPLERWALSMLGRLRLGRLLGIVGAIDRMAAEAFEFTPFTPVFNVTGQPAVSVPLAWSREGLPIGIHLAAPFGDEATLFRLAGRLEEARPWFHRLPEWVREEEPTPAPA